MNKTQVTNFLKEFMEKKRFYGILFLDNRGKNFETLAALDIRPVERERVLDSLIVEDYSEGPIPEQMYGGTEMWVFGKHVRGDEIYIKITKGRENSNTLCISFHIAEYKMKYPFKS
ncbi:hypothetical protein [Roseivirga pacifica]|uniref:hypothetical protein n=1 Tax=Roseivirga pacifica TaxID=1267423 RepID=UPI003BAF1750